MRTTTVRQPRERRVKVGACICNDVQELCFPVSMNNNPRKTNSEYAKVVTGIINGEEVDLNYCSKVYQLVPNENIFPQIEQVLFNHAIDFRVEYKHINHVRFYADYEINDKEYTYKMKGSVSDEIKPMIRVQHSYNGLTKYRITFGYFRLVCTNGLTIPVQEMKEFNLSIVGKHTSVILHSFEKLSEMLVYFSMNAKQVTEKITRRYEMLADSQVLTPRARIEEVLNAVKIPVVDNNKFSTVNDILMKITEEAKNEYGGNINDWLVYNGINRYINDNSRNIATPEVRMEKDSKVLSYLLANC